MRDYIMEPEYPFTSEQYDALSVGQREVIRAVADYLNGDPLPPPLTDEALSECFNLLRPVDGCVPFEEGEEDLRRAIRKKYAAVYSVARDLAEAALSGKGYQRPEHFNLCLVIEPDDEDSTQVVILDYQRPAYYLHEQVKPWNFHFHSLAEIAEEVLRVKEHVVAKATEAMAPRDLLIVVQEGRVREVVNLPENTRVTILDYDLEAGELAEAKPSPLDGHLCYLTKF